MLVGVSWVYSKTSMLIGVSRIRFSITKYRWGGWRECTTVPLVSRSRERFGGSDRLCLFATWAPNVRGFTLVGDHTLRCCLHRWSMSVVVSIVVAGEELAVNQTLKSR